MSAEPDPSIDQLKQSMADVFSRASQIYGQVGPRIFDYFGRRLVELAEVQPGTKVLDVATGRGAVLFPAAEHVGPTGKVTGIDIAAGMVQKTQRQIEANAVKNAEVKLMDAEKLNFPDANFDHILCGFAVFFFPRPLKALAEFQRVLKPNGVLAFTTFHSLFGEEWSWFGKLVQAFSPSRSEPEQPSKPSEPDYETAEGLTNLLSDSGYGDIRVVFEEVEFKYRNEAEWWETLWSVRMREFLEALEARSGPEGLNRFKQAAFKELAAIKQSDGIPQRFPVNFCLGRKIRDEQINA